VPAVSIPVPAYKISLISSAFFFAPPESSSRDLPFLIYFSVLEKWLISAQFSANFSVILPKRK
jgi:hypothetical protein